MDPRKDPPVALKSHEDWLRDRGDHLNHFRALMLEAERKEITIPQMAYGIVGVMLAYRHNDEWSDKVFDIAGHLETYPDKEITADSPEYKELKMLLNKGWEN